LADYKKELVRSANSQLMDKNGYMVHFVPPTRCSDFAALTCKLTKQCYDTLRGASVEPIKMLDGSLWSREANWNAEDVQAMVDRKKRRQKGPFFIRLGGVQQVPTVIVGKKHSFIIGFSDTEVRS
jgi:hypothetical protein